MTTRPQRLGILGGTLDPVHFGHLDAAEAARQALALDELWFVPSHDPPHRLLDPLASPFHRFAMVSLVAAEHPAYRASDIELRRAGPSYTIDTLKELHGQGWQPAQLFFIVGVDAFADVASWRAYPAVLEAANFVVIPRAGAAAQVALHAPELATPCDGGWGCSGKLGRDPHFCGRGSDAGRVVVTHQAAASSQREHRRPGAGGGRTSYHDLRAVQER